MKHICFVEYGYPHPHGGGGAGTFVRIIGQALSQAGIKVSVVSSHCPACPDQYQDQGVQVYRIRQKGQLHWYLGKLPGFRIFSQAARTLEHGWSLFRFLIFLEAEKEIELIEFSEGGDFWHSIKKSIPYISHLHGSRYTFMKMSGRIIAKGDWYDRRLELHMIQRASWVISPSQAILDIVQQELNSKIQNATVIPYPLDPKFIKSPGTKQTDQESTKTILFAARNDPVKGGDILIKAVPLVLSRFPNVQFKFFGYQPSENEKIPVNTSISPFTPKEELDKVYQEVDLCVVPSLWDNSPFTIYEAMASGKAVVATRVGGIPELVEHGQTGLLVSPGDVHELAEAICTLLSDDRLRVRMGLRARERIFALAEPQKNLERRLAIYNKVLEQQKNPGS